MNILASFFLFFAAIQRQGHSNEIFSVKRFYRFGCLRATSVAKKYMQRKFCSRCFARNQWEMGNAREGKHNCFS